MIGSQLETLESCLQKLENLGSMSAMLGCDAGAWLGLGPLYIAVLSKLLLDRLLLLVRELQALDKSSRSSSLSKLNTSSRCISSSLLSTTELSSLLSSLHLICLTPVTTL